MAIPAGFSNKVRFNAIILEGATGVPIGEVAKEILRGSASFFQRDNQFSGYGKFLDAGEGIVFFQHYTTKVNEHLNTIQVGGTLRERVNASLFSGYSPGYLDDIEVGINSKVLQVLLVDLSEDHAMNNLYFNALSNSKIQNKSVFDVSQMTVQQLAYQILSITGSRMRG